jgi:hypothetical protein
MRIHPAVGQIIVIYIELQPVLIQPCSTLVSADGSLTSQGTHAMIV